MRAEHGVTTLAEEHQAVGDDRQIAETGAREVPRNDIVEAVADDGEHDVVSTAKGDKAGEAGVDIDSVENAVEGGAAAMQKRDLTGHAVGGADQARPPLRFDIAPARSGEGLEQNVGDIAGRNRSVEIDRKSVV